MTQRSGNEGIYNQELLERLENDRKQYEILYLYAPFGWEKEAVIRALYEKSASKEIYWLEETAASDLAQQFAQLPKTKHAVYIIANLEVIIENGNLEVVCGLLKEKRPEETFVIASSVMLPEEILPYTILYRFVSYGIEDIKPRSEDVASYMKRRGISLSKEDLFYIEKDCKNLPLYIQLLANLLINTNRGYTRSVMECAFEDLFTYIDVMFFRGFRKEEQNAMLRLSCLEEFDNALIADMLDISRKEADALVERLLLKSSVLEKSKNGWTFYPMMKLYLRRVLHKYLSYEDLLVDYRRAMNYQAGCENWLSALKFAYILKDTDQIAKYLDIYLRENADYSNLEILEDYFEELPTNALVKYPNLLLSGSILKATVGDVSAAKKYEQMYCNLIAQTEDAGERSRMYAQLLMMYLSRPGTLSADEVMAGAELFEAWGESVTLQETQKFEPHYISVLRGARDYTRYFRTDESTEKLMERLHAVSDRLSDRTFAVMLNYMEAEVYYERNDLDRALDQLVKTTREAKVGSNQRMQQLCIIGMVDLLASKNQMNRQEIAQLERLEAESKDAPLFWENCQAHIIYYHLLRGDADPIEHWMKYYAPDETGRFFATRYYQYLIKAKVYLWMGQYVRARMILQLLMDYAVQYHMSYLEAQVRTLESYIYFIEGSAQWKENLIPALEWAKELGFIRVFADEGAAAYEMLSRLIHEDPVWAKDEYLKKVLNAAKAQMLQYPKYLKQEKQGAIGEFSESERAVMKLLVLGEKNAVIAERLCVSENTVKYHLKNIYQKLQVTSRGQAITRIRENDLI